MKIGYGLHVKNSSEAVEFYMKVFGLELGYHVKNPDGSYFHSELYKDGEEMLNVIESFGVAGTVADVKENVVQLGVTLADETAVQKAFALLSDGGTIKTSIGPLPWSPCAAEVIDRFGVWWFVTAPMHLPPDDYDSNAPWDASMYRKPEGSEDE
jgi:PhnB protein